MSTARAAADRAAGLKLVPVSRETERRFDILIHELGRWRGVKNLLGAAELERIWTRHIADSAQLRAVAPCATQWLDLGSGGGFPGLVLGILLAEEGGGDVALIESNGRKCAFLRAAARATGARARVRHGRVEDLVHEYLGKADAVTARAVAPLGRLIEWTNGLLRTGTVGIFPKGQDVDAELTEASKSWRIVADQNRSLTDPKGCILVVRGLEPRQVS